MFQLFLKSKKAIILSATVAIISVAVLVGGITVSQNKKTRFPANGYVMQVETSEDSQAVANQVRFASGTAMNKKASSKITFKSEEGQTVESKSDAFIHYEDGSLSSAYGMTLTDLSRFPEGLIDSYYMDSMMVLENGGSAYTIQNNTEKMAFDNFLLKTGDQKYLCVSPTLTLARSNSGSDTVENGYLELTYIDEDGMVLNATDGTSAWQFLADSSTITFANGAVLDLGRMELTSGTTDSETGAATASLKITGISVSADVGIVVANNTATNWTAPTFVNHAVAGKDGSDGVQGQDGEIGDDGEDGEVGQDGAVGEAGATGTDGGNGGSGGNGQKGAAGQDGNNIDDDNRELADSPFVNVTSWDQTAGSIAFTLKAFNTELIQESTTEAYIVNTATGATYKVQPAGMELTKLGEDDAEFFYPLKNTQEWTEYFTSERKDWNFRIWGDDVWDFAEPYMAVTSSGTTVSKYPSAVKTFEYSGHLDGTLYVPSKEDSKIYVPAVDENGQVKTHELKNMFDYNIRYNSNGSFKQYELSAGYVFSKMSGTLSNLTVRDLSIGILRPVHEEKVSKILAVQKYSRRRR